MKKIFVLLLFLCFANAGITQIIIPTKLGKDFERGYYDLPLKLVVKNIWNAGEDERSDMINTIRDFGFKDTIILITPPEYPNKAFRDSIDLICNKAKVASVVEINFKSYIKSWYNIAKSEMTAITLSYKAYDYNASRVINPGILFGAGSFQSIKKMFNNAIPKNQ